MIETTIPEINVSELMERVRAKASEARKMSPPSAKKLSASTGPNLPSLEIVPPPPPLILPQPPGTRKERILSILAQARQSTQVSGWIPKPVRRFFRKQGGYNRMLLESVTVLTKRSEELARRLEQLTACVQVQHEWLGVLQRRSEQDGAWMNTAAQILGAVSGELHRLNRKDQEIERQFGTRLSEWRIELDGIGQHLRNLQSWSDRSSALELALQKGQEELLSGFQRLRADSEHSAEHVRNLQEEVGRNAVLLNELQNLRSALQSGPEQIRKLQEELERHAAAELTLQKQQEELSNGFESLRSDAERTGEHLRNLQNESLRSGAAAKDFQRQFDRLEERLTVEGAFLRAQLSHHGSLLQRGAKVKKDADGLLQKSDPNKETPGGAIDERFDAFYMSFEDRFRGSRDEIKERISFYLPYIWENNAGTPERPVLDLGCGRGEWLELLRDIGANARGVDINSAMLALCRQRRLDVIQADVLEYLRSLPDNSQSAVTGFHIIEHLAFDTLMDVLTETQRVVAPGGLVILESPNCKNLIVGACNFYIDPTHRNPVFPDTAKFMLDRVGFERIELEYLTPIATTPFDGDGEGQPVLKELLYGPQDFAVIGHKAPAS